MSNRFLTSGNQDGLEGLTDGTFNLNVNSVTIDGLLPELPVKTDGDRKLVSGNLDIADTINLQSELDNKNKLDFTEVISPAAPVADTLRLFAKDNKFYYKNDLGVESEIATSSAGVTGNTWEFFSISVRCSRLWSVSI